MEIKKLHCLIIAIVAIVSFSLVSCENENIDTPTSVSEVNELNTTQSDEGLVQTRSSDCSYPYGGENLTGFIHGQQELSPGKYYHRVKINDAAIPQEKNFSFRVISGGPVITRSVYVSRNWFSGRESYSLYESCQKTDDIRSFNAYNTADDNYDYIDYEIITEVNADISWNERN